MTSVEPQTPQDEQDEQASTVASDRLDQLKQLYPEAFREGQLDVDALRLAAGLQVDERRERYSFSWAGKREAILAVQQPAQASLVPADEQSLNPTSTANYFIEGDNLEVLKLLYKPYAGKVKLIYIDPPYNTGNDFIYPDNFREPLQQYLRVTGQTDAAGNTTSSELDRTGHKHSSWLTMMYPRLLLARQLLRDDGTIFVSIDEIELSNLLLLMDEVFGEDNKEAVISWRRRHNQPNDATKMIATVAEYMVVYTKDSVALKSKKSFYGLPLSETRKGAYGLRDDDEEAWDSIPWKVSSGHSGSRYTLVTPTGVEYTEEWAGTKVTFDKLLAEGSIYFPRSGSGLPRKKVYLKDRLKSGQVAHNFWGHKEFGSNQDASDELEELMDERNLMDHPKPVKLIKSILSITTRDNDLILDFFAGSGTTAQAVLELNREDGGNRRFILVQLPEPTGNPNYPTIAEIGKERVRRVIKRMQAADAGKLDLSTRTTPEDLGFRVFRQVASSYKRWQPQGQQDYLSQLVAHSEPLTDGWQATDLLWELALREGYSLTTTITALGNDLYRVADPGKEQAVLVSLADQLRGFTLDGGMLDGATLFLCRDSALDDSGIANLKLQAKSLGLRFRTI